MSTITSLLGTDLITDSRTDINDNFNNLNTDKIETSVIDTDTTLAANSDAKLPSQKAVKAYVDAGGNVNASTTAKGIVEEATSADIIAGTGTGGTGARLFVNPTAVAETGNDKIVKTKSTGLLDTSILPTTTVTTLFPIPNWAAYSETTYAIAANTVLVSFQVVVPFTIVVNKIYFSITAVGTSGSIKVALFSQDGQTQYFSVTSTSISGTGLFGIDVSAVTISPGIYYMSILRNGTTDVTFRAHSAVPTDFNNPASEPLIIGTTTVTASTMPSTITPGSLGGSTSNAIFRLDN